jgi:hypothetical protein
MQLAATQAAITGQAAHLQEQQEQQGMHMVFPGHRRSCRYMRKSKGIPGHPLCLMPPQQQQQRLLKMTASHWLHTVQVRIKHNRLADVWP